MKKVGVYVLVLVFLASASLALDINIISPVSGQYSTTDIPLQVSFSENFFSWKYELNGVQTPVCSWIPGQSAVVSQNNGAVQSNWILYSNNDAQIRFDSSMIPAGQPEQASLCMLLYDNSATQEASVQFRVNNGRIYNIIDDASLAVGVWSWKCQEINSTDFSDHYTITMWYSDRAASGGVFIANSGAVAGSFSYWNADAANAPASPDDSIPWSYYGGNTDWAVNLSIRTGSTYCPLTYSGAITVPYGSNSLTVFANNSLGITDQKTVIFEVVAPTMPASIDNLTIIPSVISVGGQVAIRAGASGTNLSSVSARIVSPDGSSANSQMFDDGLHNDFNANDNVFGLFYTAASLGAYQVNVTAAAQDSSASAQSSFQAVSDLFKITSPAGNTKFNSTEVMITTLLSASASRVLLSVDNSANITACQHYPARAVAVNFSTGTRTSNWVLSADNDARINFKKEDLPKGQQLAASLCFYVSDADAAQENSLDFRVNNGPVHQIADDAASMPVGSWVWVCSQIDSAELSDSYSVAFWYNNRASTGGVYIGNDNTTSGTSSFFDNSTGNSPQTSTYDILWTAYPRDTDWMVRLSLDMAEFNCLGSDSYPVSQLSPGVHIVTAFAEVPPTYSDSVQFEIIDLQNLSVAPKSVKPGTPVVIKAKAVSSQITSVSAVIKPTEGTPTTITLYDDGLHSDGAASDKVYGNSFTPQYPSYYTVDVVLSCPGAAVTKSTGFIARSTRAAVVYSNTTYRAMNSVSQSNGIHYLEWVGSVQHELVMAGIPFDVIGEKDLLNPEKIEQYNVLVLPSFANVLAADRDATIQNLETAVAQKGIGIFAFGSLMSANELNAQYTYAAGQNPLNRILNAQKGSRSAASADYYLRAMNSSHPSAWRSVQGQNIMRFEWDPYSECLVYNSSVSYAYPYQIYSSDTSEYIPVTVATQRGAGRAFYASTSETVAETALGRDALLWVLYGNNPQFGIKLTNSTAIFTIRVDADVSYDTPQNVLSISNFKQITGNHRLKGGWCIVTKHSNTSPVSWEQLTDDYLGLYADGHEICSHSMTHPASMNVLTDSRVYADMYLSRVEISNALGLNVRGLANPGDSPEQLRLWRIADEAGYSYYSPLKNRNTKAFGFIDNTLKVINLQSNTISDYELMMEGSMMTPAQAAQHWTNEFKEFYKLGDGIVVYALWHDYLLDEAYPAYDIFGQYLKTTDTESITPIDLVDRFLNWSRQDFSVSSSIVNGSTVWSITRLSPDVKFGQLTVNPGMPINQVDGAGYFRKTFDNKSYMFSFASDTVSFYFNKPLVLNPVPDKTINETQSLVIRLNATYSGTGALAYSKNVSFGVLNSATGVFDWTPPVNSSGSYSVLFTVTDGVYSDSAKARITVNPYVASNQSNQTNQTPAQPLNYMFVSAGGNHSCGILLNNSAYCFGAGNYGQLGNGATAQQNKSVPVSITSSFSSVNAGKDHSCGVLANGSVFCWGIGTYGRLGNGATTNKLVPTGISSKYTFTSVSAGNYHSCGILANGSAMCWGRGNSGQLGNGATSNKLVPTAVNIKATFISISAGDSHTCGILSNGSAFCWGAGGSGRLGNGATTNKLVPTAVNSSVVFSSISAGTTHSCGILSNGSAFCWGAGGSGRLGNGATTNKLVPTAVSLSSQFTSISAGNAHSCGVLTTGAAYCWGAGGSGRLGNGATTNKLVPTPVATSVLFSSISAGNLHSCATGTDNIGYCWGAGSSGQLGDNTGLQRTTPTVVV